MGIDEAAFVSLFYLQQPEIYHAPIQNLKQSFIIKNGRETIRLPTEGMAYIPIVYALHHRLTTMGINLEYFLAKKYHEMGKKNCGTDAWVICSHVWRMAKPGYGYVPM